MNLSIHECPLWEEISDIYSTSILTLWTLIRFYRRRYRVEFGSSVSSLTCSWPCTYLKYITYINNFTIGVLFTCHGLWITHPYQVVFEEVFFVQKLLLWRGLMKIVGSRRKKPNATEFKRIALQNVIALFDLKTKFTRPLPAQCASKRDTEWTCGAFCADVDAAIYFFILRFIQPESLRFGV